jgi:hypothetical protein
MRRFRVWVEYGSSRPLIEAIVTVLDAASDRECDEACVDAVYGLVKRPVLAHHRGFETGWEDVGPDGEP